MKTQKRSLCEPMNMAYRGNLYIVTGLTLLLGMGFSFSAGAVATEVNSNPTLSISSNITPISRTFEQMQADQFKMPVLAREEAPFRPTMTDAEYQQAKAIANQNAANVLRPLKEPTKLAPATLKNVNCKGLLYNGWTPPDTHGAVGHTHYVQAVNSDIAIYTRAVIEGDINIPCGPPTKQVSLNAFMGYFTQPLFDPRVVYDHHWRRWIVTAPAFEESATIQYQFVAVSKTADAAGAYWIYKFNMGPSGEFYDYPQLGFDADAIIMTANIFNPGFTGSRITALSKSRTYNGLAVQYCNWSGGTLAYSTFAPPIVRDLGNETWIAAAGSSDTKIRVTRWNNMGHVCGNFIGTKDITVPAYSVPPSATQPGTTQLIDTLDSRFVNASTQIGKYLYNTHTVALGTATPKRYKIDVAAGTATPIWFFSTLTSHDFNASIAVSDNLNEYITFSSSDNSTFPQVRFGGKQNADTSFGLVTAYSSTAASPGFRWGDYSAITVDPTNQTNAWGVNEFIQSSGGWGSEVFRIGIP